MKNRFSEFKTFLMISLFALLVSCDSQVLWEDQLYEVSWIDSKENLILNRKINDGASSIGRVTPKVVAVGSNDQYVVAKTRNLRTGLIFYFYIDKRIDNDFLNQKDVTKGPFSEELYQEHKMRLSLPEFSAFF